MKRLQRLRGWIRQRSRQIGSALLLLGLVTCAIALVLAVVIPERRAFFVIYTAPLLLAGPLWLRLRLARMDSFSQQQLTLDALVFLAAALRMFGGWGVLPYSGHMLFLTYSILTTGHRAYVVVAAALIIMTTIYKLSIWGDWSTWLWGLALGLLSAGFWHLYRTVVPGRTVSG